MSKRSLTRSELSKFFAQGEKRAQDKVSERLSQMSKGSRLKNNLAKKAEDVQSQAKSEAKS